MYLPTHGRVPLGKQGLAALDAAAQARVSSQHGCVRGPGLRGRPEQQLQVAAGGIAIQALQPLERRPLVQDRGLHTMSTDMHRSERQLAQQKCM